MLSAPEHKKTVEVFLSYAREDSELRNELMKHLLILKRKGLITSWYEHEISAGKEWQNEIDKHLDSAQLVLLLISSDFMASDYCYGSEMLQALKNHDLGKSRVIPIILRPVDWRDTPLDKLQVLPRNAKPLTNWQNKDEAFFEISKEIRYVVEEIFKKNASSFPFKTSVNFTEEPPLPLAWNVPYKHNPFFTGREGVLKQLYESLIKSKTSVSSFPQLQALSGIGGIGKTQIAIEYAYRYSRNYQAIFWVRADSHMIRTADFVNIAHLLDLPEKDVQEQHRTVAAVQRWLEKHTDWLLIIDNADNLDMVSDFIPLASKGHILITTRTISMSGLVKPIIINRMNNEEGALFLLRRAKAISHNTPLNLVSENQRTAAVKVTDALEGLSFALDLAGAYLERTKISVKDYFLRYLAEKSIVQQKQSDLPASLKPASVALTLFLKNVKETHPSSIDPLYFCAFLYPEAIPEEILTKEFPEFYQTLQSFSEISLKLENAVEERPKSSKMISHTTTKMFSIHRLIQELLRDDMSKDVQLLWAERAVKSVNRVFPPVEFTKWENAQRYLPQVEMCATHIKQYTLQSSDATQLLLRAADYLKERGLYSQAELLGMQVLEMQEQAFVQNHLDISQSLINLAEIYRTQGKYKQAERFYDQALLLCKKTLGPNAPEVARILRSIAMIYNEQGMYTNAEVFCRQALKIRRQVLGLNHPDVAQSLNDLALLYASQGMYDEAEHLFMQALSTRENILGSNHPDVATSLNNLATIFNEQGKYDEAEQLFQRALSIDKKNYGHYHPNIARDLNNLGGVVEAKGNLLEAQSLYEQSLNIDQKAYGLDHPNVAGDLNNLGSVLRKLGDLLEAQSLYEQSLNIDQKAYGLDHPNVAIRLNNLGSILQEQGQLETAQALYEQALTIIEAYHGQNTPSAASILNNLASIYQSRSDLPEAQTLYEQALTTSQAIYGPDHITVGNIVNNLAGVLQEMGNVETAQVYYRQALQIFVKHWGENHPLVLRITDNLAKVNGDNK